MTDRTKLDIIALAATVLVAFTLLYNAVGDTLVDRVLARWERKAYFEKVLAPRGLSLREAEFWEPAGSDAAGR